MKYVLMALLFASAPMAMAGNDDGAQQQDAKMAATCSAQADYPMCTEWRRGGGWRHGGWHHGGRWHRGPYCGPLGVRCW